jgi:hypothetical protein
MDQMRPTKRARYGGSFHDAVPLTDDYSIVHAREGRLKRVGNSVLTAPTNRTAHHESDNSWSTTANWTPFDDPDFALDPNEDSYNEILNREVMEGLEPAEGLPTPKANPKRSFGATCYLNNFAHTYISLYHLRNDHM